MSKPIIAVDHYEELVRFHNQKYDTNLTIDDYTNDHWSEVWGTTAEETERRAKEFAALGIQGRKIKKGAAESLRKLHQKYDLVIVTVRRKVMVEATLIWVEAELPGLFSAVRFVPIWEEKDSPSKADICLELGASYLIDDSLKHCGLSAAAGLQAILFGDYAWNLTDVLPRGVVRCKDWPAVLEYFDGIG